MTFGKHIAALCFAALATAALGEDARQLNPQGEFWKIWGHAKIDTPANASAPSGHMVRVVIAPKPENPWEIGAEIRILQPVKKDDVLLLSFWARGEQMPAGSDFVVIKGRIFENTQPFTGVTAETTFLIGKEWKQFYASGPATKDYPAGTLNAGMQIGTGEQIVEFGPVSVVNYGPGYDVAKLPHN